MKKKFLAVGLCTLLSVVSLSAKEDTRLSEKENLTPYYMVVKFMSSKGGTVYEENAVLDGNRAHGIGIDVGYKFNPQFGVEFAGTYGRGDVKKTEESLPEIEIAGAEYTSYALNLVFSQPLLDEIGFFAKLGYEKEHEKICAFDMSEDAYGVDYAVGFDYELDEHKAILIEYEKTTIDGLLGDLYFAGLEYRF